jgi:hypothetical protein
MGGADRMTKQKQSVWENAHTRTEKNLAERLARAICERAGVEAEITDSSISDKSSSFKCAEIWPHKTESRMYSREYGGNECIPQSWNDKNEYHHARYRVSFDPDICRLTFKIWVDPVIVKDRRFEPTTPSVAGSLMIARYADKFNLEYHGPSSGGWVGTDESRLRLVPDNASEIASMIERGDITMAKELLDKVQLPMYDLFERYDLELNLLGTSKRDKEAIANLLNSMDPRSRSCFDISEDANVVIKSRLISDKDRLRDLEFALTTYIQNCYPRFTIQRMKFPLPGIPITPEVSQGLDYLADTLGEIRRLVEAGR